MARRPADLLCKRISRQFASVRPGTRGCWSRARGMWRVLACACCDELGKNEPTAAAGDHGKTAASRPTPSFGRRRIRPGPRPYSTQERAPTDGLRSCARRFHGARDSPIRKGSFCDRLVASQKESSLSLVRHLDEVPAMRGVFQQNRPDAKHGKTSINADSTPKCNATRCWALRFGNGRYRVKRDRVGGWEWKPVSLTAAERRCL